MSTSDTKYTIQIMHVVMSTITRISLQDRTGSLVKLPVSKLFTLSEHFSILFSGLQLHDKSLGRILLALLYTLLHEGELRSAVELTELLIRQQDARSTLSVCSQDAVTKTNILSLLQKVSPQVCSGSNFKEKFIQREKNMWECLGLFF